VKAFTDILATCRLAVSGIEHPERKFRSNIVRTEDGYIVQKCLDGDSAAFGLLVDRYKKSIYALAYSKVHNFHDAQDITQEAFIKAYRNLRTLRRWDNFIGWLYRITINLSRDWLRSRARRPDSEFTEDQDPETLDYPAMDSYREDMVHETVREALDSLPEMYREVLTLRYFGGMNIKEISRFLGTSPSTIDRRLRGARARLKEEMIAMMSATYEKHELPENFTFRMVEIVKRIKIDATPRSTGLPWGLSLAAGIAVVIMTFGSQMAIYKQPTPLAFSSETETPKVREMAVDILRVPGTSVMAGNQGDTDGVGIDQRSPQINSLLAPAKGGGTWTQKADMPTARSNLGSALVDGKIYVIGGTPSNGGAVASAEEYDPATDIWTKRANMPTAREGIRAAAVDGIVYAIGGWKPGGDTSILEAYDPATDKWTRKANMPTRRTMTAVAVVDGIIYVIGGELGSTPLSVVEAYDPATDKWTRMADMPTARYMAGYCVIDGLIYVFGGATERNPEFIIWGSVPTVEVYDPATNTWVQSSDMPRPRLGHTTSVVDGMIYIVGGIDSGVVELFFEGKLEQAEVGKLSSIVDVYDPDTDMWTTAANLPLKLDIGFHTAAVVNGKIYVMGGSRGPEGTRLSEVYEFTPGLPHSVSTVKPERKGLTTWGQVRSDE
jgi:RNA polymerase sigma factor (sigma-70 family)